MSYTIVPNQLLEDSDLSLAARYLYVVLLRHCHKDNTCFPSQGSLGKIIKRSERQVYNLLKELETAQLISISYRGYNKTLNYHLHVFPDRLTDQKSISTQSNQYQKPISGQTRNQFPLRTRNQLLPNITSIKVKEKKELPPINENNQEMIDQIRKKHTFLKPNNPKNMA